MRVWKICVVVLFLVNMLLVYSTIVSKDGYLAYNNLVQKYSSVTHELQRVERDNRILSHEIRLLKNDKEYLSNVIRTKMHMLKENEALYLFP